MANVLVLLKTLGAIFVGLVPWLAAGYLLAVTAENNPIPGVIANIGSITVLIGVLLAPTVYGANAIVIPIVCNEGLSAKDGFKRRIQLIGKHVRPKLVSNPASSWGFFLLFVYGLLRLGISGLAYALDLEELIGNYFSSDYLVIVLTNAVNVIPEFLVAWILSPYLFMVAALLYWQRRIIVEGHDIKEKYLELPLARR